MRNKTASRKQSNVDYIFNKKFYLLCFISSENRVKNVLSAGAVFGFLAMLEKAGTGGFTWKFDGVRIRMRLRSDNHFRKKRMVNIPIRKLILSLTNEN
jgi:hypothetical protein